MLITLEEAGRAVASIQPHEWMWIVLGSWIVAGAIAAPILGRMIRLGDDGTVRTDYRPPVPPARRLSDAEVDRRIPALEALFAEADQ